MSGNSLAAGKGKENGRKTQSRTTRIDTSGKSDRVTTAIGYFHGETRRALARSRARNRTRVRSSFSLVAGNKEDQRSEQERPSGDFGNEVGDS